MRLFIFIGVWLGFCSINLLAVSQELPSLSFCTQQQIERALAETGAYEPLQDEFVRVESGQFWLGPARYVANGVNYYPMRYPWRRFLTETDLKTVDYELSLLRDSGLNTLRIFLWHDALFDCEGNGAIPNAEAFHRLDEFLHKSAIFGFRVIVTLNDMPDFDLYPLYSRPEYNVQQTAFIVTRYREEATILAWDVRNEGDIDYGSYLTIPAKAPKAMIMEWLEATTQQIRHLDDQHLLTAGWLYDAESTVPFVDFVSFHHWTTVEDLNKCVMMIRQATNKPILLEEFGYSTQRVTEEEQSQRISDIIVASESQGLLGWLICTAFDFSIDRTCYPSSCQSPDNAEHYFGIWRTDYSAKPAINALKSQPQSTKKGR